MKKSVWTKLIFLFTTLLSCSAPFSQDIKHQSPAINFIQKVDSIVISKINQYNIPGLSIGLVKNDSIIYAKGYGIRNIENDNLVTENTIFHTASISKLFTAIAIMQLAEEGQLALDDRLSDMMPELSYSDSKVENITLKQMLNHTSGIPDVNNYNWSNNNQADSSLKDYILGLNLKLESPPSTEFLYSNLAYDILGYVIEKTSSSTFEDYVKKNILNPSGMSNSDFRYFKIPDSLKTSPHSKNRLTRSVYARKTYPYTREHAPSSTLNSSARELSNWMISFFRALDTGELANIYNSMLEPTFDSNKHIGLGFQLSTIDNKKKVGHYGGDKGFRSYLLMIPESKIGLVLLANCDYNEDFRQEILHPIAKVILTTF